MSDTQPAKTINSVETACDIVDVLHRTGGLTVTETSEEVGMTPGAVHAHLATLKKKGLVVQEGTIYRLSPKVISYSTGYQNRNGLYRAGKQKIDQLADETDELSHLVIEHDGELIVLYERFGRITTANTYHTSERARTHLFIYATAAGKAILAYLPDDRVESILENRGIQKWTPDTITEQDDLLEELSRIRERGYALNDEEQLKGLRAVAAPILLNDDTVVGTVCVSGLASRLRGEMLREELPKKVVEAANLIQLNLQSNASEQ